MKFKVGQIVVCIKSNDPQWAYLVGAVGEIKGIMSPLQMLLEGFDPNAGYVVDFPAHRDDPCPDCGKTHGTMFAMADEELKALDDPDQAKDRITQKDKPEILEAPRFGLITTRNEAETVH